MRTQWSDTKCELKVFQFWFQTFLKLYKIWKVNDVSGSQTGTQMIKQQLSGFVFQTYINNLTARLNSMFLVISFLQWWHIWKNLKIKGCWVSQVLTLLLETGKIRDGSDLNPRLHSWVKGNFSHTTACCFSGKSKLPTADFSEAAPSPITESSRAFVSLWT